MMIHSIKDIFKKKRLKLSNWFNAAKMGNLKTLKEIRKAHPKMDPHMTDKKGRTALHYATQDLRGQGKKKIPVIEYLINTCKISVDTHTKDKNGWTCFHTAATAVIPPYAIVRWLIKHTLIDPNIGAYDGRTILHLAVAVGHPLATIKFLVEEIGVNPKFIDCNGNLPIAYNKPSSKHYKAVQDYLSKK